MSRLHMGTRSLTMLSGIYTIRFRRLLQIILRNSTINSTDHRRDESLEVVAVVVAGSGR